MPLYIYNETDDSYMYAHNTPLGRGEIFVKDNKYATNYQYVFKIWRIYDLWILKKHFPGKKLYFKEC